MAVTATVTNISRQMVQIILDHPAFADRRHGWQRTTVDIGFADDNGQRRIETQRRAYPGTVTILPGQSLEGMHPAVKSCSQVPGLVANRVVTIKMVEEKTA